MAKDEASPTAAQQAELLKATFGKIRFSRVAFLVFAAFGGVAGLLLAYAESAPVPEYLVYTAIGAGGAAAYYVIIVGVAQFMTAQLRFRLLEQNRIAETTQDLQQDIEKDFFNNLIKINFKYIDKYYLQTQLQADKAFIMSSVAAFLGFAIVVAGVVQMYIGDAEPAYVTTAAGVVSEFIASVFFYLYNKTILKMGDYHRKLVLTQNVGLALRITQDMPDAQRLAAQISLVDRLSEDINQLLAGEGPLENT